MRYEPVCRGRYISYGGVSLVLSPPSPGRTRGCAVIEQLRRPSDIVLKKTRLRLYLPGKNKKAAFSRRMDTESVSALSERISAAASRREEQGGTRAMLSGPAFMASVTMSHIYIAAALFSPLLRLAAPFLAVAAGQMYKPYHELLQKGSEYLWAVPPLIALLHIAAISVKTGYIHYYDAGGVISIARGAVVRRVLHFPPDAADAAVSIETPLAILLKKRICFIIVSGKGPVAVPSGSLPECGQGREIMRLERHSPEGGTWGGYMIAAIAVSVIALHYAIKYYSDRYIILSALLPFAALLMYRGLAEAAASRHPALRMYRDTVTVSGVWGLCVVSETVGRDNIADAVISQNIIQKSRGLCDLTVKAAGHPRPVRCRNVDMLRAKALITRLARS